MPNERPVSEPAALHQVWGAPLSAAPEAVQPVVVVASPALPARRSRWPKLAAVVPGLALAVTLAIGGAQWSSAQRRDPPRIVVAPTIVAEPASQAPLIIQVSPLDSLPNNSFLRLRGFPASVSLTEGHAIAPGSWAVPLFSLSSLRAIVPAGVSGRNEISINLVGMDGTTLAESRTALVIAAPTPPPQPRAVPLAVPPDRLVPESAPRRATPLIAPLPPARTPAAAPDLSDDEKARAERMLAQGTKHLEQGNISAARMFFQRAAEAGLADGAIKMGGTYDPVELSRLTALAGVSGDRNEARKWYERARDLGAAEAEDRLGRLTGR